VRDARQEPEWPL